MSDATAHSATIMPSTRTAPIALVLLVAAPTIGVLAALWWEATRGTAIGQAVYLLSKAWILVLPLVWHVKVDRGRIAVSRPTRDGIRAGLGWGAAIAVAIVAGYWVVGRHIIDADELQNAVATNDLDQPGNYLLLVIGLTFFNSLLEEYVWRWFVYRQCEALMTPRVAVVVSALLFTLHHFLALKAQMGMAPTLLACSGIFTGGCVWSGLFRRFRSVWPGYASHILADAAVFLVGWWLIFG